MNKKPVLISIAVIVIALVLIGVSRYLTRPASAPTQVPEGSVSETKPVLEGERIYRIGEGSKAEFRIGEILRDKPFTAIGATSNILGDIILSDAALGFGTIKVNARTFKTDSENRDGAIARMILKAEKPEHEWITFRVTSVSGLPPAAPMQTDIPFSMTGDLTIAGVTKSITFSTTMKITEAAITGTATATLKRSDFNLTIPNIPFVASVDDSFPISVTIVAPVVAK